MQIGSLAPWFGSKRTIAPAIVEAIGPHAVYWEPFCGSLAVLLAKPRCKTEVVNDLHGDLVNLARVVQDPRLGPALYRRLRRVWMCQGLFEDSKGALNSCRDPFAVGADPDVDRAFHYFVYCWQGINGVAGIANRGSGFARRFTSSGGDGATRWNGAVGSIPAWRRRMRGLNILNSDGIELCERIEDEEHTVIYCDPPYFEKGAEYLHDFAAADHLRLAAALKRFRRARVVVSYYADPRLEELYPGWHTRSIRAAKGLVNAGKKDRSRVDAPEVLLSNQPFRTHHTPSLFGD